MSSDLRFDIYDILIASRETSVESVDRRMLEGARAWFSSCLGTTFSNRCVSSPFRPVLPVCSFRS